MGISKCKWDSQDKIISTSFFMIKQRAVLLLILFRVLTLKMRTWRNFLMIQGSWKSLKKAKSLKKNLRRDCWQVAKSQSRQQIPESQICRMTADPRTWGETHVCAPHAAGGSRWPSLHVRTSADTQEASHLCKLSFQTGERWGRGDSHSWLLLETCQPRGGHTSVNNRCRYLFHVSSI